MFRWSEAKNTRLKLERGVSFEEIVVAVAAGQLLDVLKHRNRDRYPRQKVLVVSLRGYAYLMPCVDEPGGNFLKTIIPSRKATRDYLKRLQH